MRTLFAVIALTIALFAMIDALAVAFRYECPSCGYRASYKILPQSPPVCPEDGFPMTFRP